MPQNYPSGFRQKVDSVSTWALHSSWTVAEGWVEGALNTSEERKQQISVHQQGVQGSVTHTREGEKGLPLDHYNVSMCVPRCKKRARRYTLLDSFPQLWGQLDLCVLSACEGKEVWEGLELRQEQKPSPHI